MWIWVLKTYKYSSTTNIQYNITTDEMILQVIFSLKNAFKRVYEKDFNTGN